MTSKRCSGRSPNSRKDRLRSSFTSISRSKSLHACKTLRTTLWSWLSLNRPSFLGWMIKDSLSMKWQLPKNLLKSWRLLADLQTNSVSSPSIYYATLSQTVISRLWKSKLIIKTRDKYSNWSDNMECCSWKQMKSKSHRELPQSSLKNNLKITNPGIRKSVRCTIFWGHNLLS
jgi:hypothetical protein